MGYIAVRKHGHQVHFFVGTLTYKPIRQYISTVLPIPKAEQSIKQCIMALIHLVQVW